MAATGISGLPQMASSSSATVHMRTTGCGIAQQWEAHAVSMIIDQHQQETYLRTTDIYIVFILTAFIPEGSQRTARGASRRSEAPTHAAAPGRHHGRASSSITAVTWGT